MNGRNSRQQANPWMLVLIVIVGLILVAAAVWFVWLSGPADQPLNTEISSADITDNVLNATLVRSKGALSKLYLVRATQAIPDTSPAQIDFDSVTGRITKVNGVKAETLLTYDLTSYEDPSVSTFQLEPRSSGGLYLYDFQGWNVSGRASAEVPTKYVYAVLVLDNGVATMIEVKVHH
jgi:hypothetical protein